MSVEDFCTFKAYMTEIADFIVQIDKLIEERAAKLQAIAGINMDDIDDLRGHVADAITDATYKTKRYLEDIVSYDDFNHHHDAQVDLRNGD